jgi:nucleotide-binding universal stress UspA family protein
VRSLYSVVDARLERTGPEDFGAAGRDGAQERAVTPRERIGREGGRCRGGHAGHLWSWGAGAALVVVGRHGRVGDREASVGSVSHAVVHYAPCPVAVVGPSQR